MINPGFMRWLNPDSTIDVICLNCFETVVKSGIRDALGAGEKDHVCNPSDLVLLRSASVPSHRQEKTAVPGIYWKNSAA
jgi:hypothetical protein